MQLVDLERLTGHSFPGGAFRIAGYEDWLMRDALGAERGDGVHAHPLWGFAAPQGAMGITVDEVFHLCGSSAADGPLLGDTQVQLNTSLLIDHTYTVSGGIVSAVRKVGRTAGVFDLVHFSVESRSADGELAARLTNSFVFPRKPS